MGTKFALIEVATRSVAYLIFLVPIIISVAFASFVMSDILAESDRELNMWQFQGSGISKVSTSDIALVGIQKEYSTNSPVSFEIRVNNLDFDCGDLYITIYEKSISSNKVFSQNGFFEQCFVKDNSLLPVDDEFSEVINVRGSYEVLVEISDKNQKEKISSRAKLTVK